MQETTREWEENKEKSRRKSAPIIPGGKWIRQARGRRHDASGLLLLYPLSANYKGFESATPILGYGISFPTSEDAVPESYAVNNIYWSQQQGELE